MRQPIGLLFLLFSCHCDPFLRSVPCFVTWESIYTHQPASALLQSSEWVGGTDCRVTMAVLGCPHPLGMGEARP